MEPSRWPQHQNQVRNCNCSTYFGPGLRCSVHVHFDFLELLLHRTLCAVLQLEERVIWEVGLDQVGPETQPGTVKSGLSRLGGLYEKLVPTPACLSLSAGWIVRLSPRSRSDCLLEENRPDFDRVLGPVSAGHAARRQAEGVERADDPLPQPMVGEPWKIARERPQSCLGISRETQERGGSTRTSRVLGVD